MPTIRRTEEFAQWLRQLGDARAKAKIALRLDRLALGNPGDVKPLGGGLSEMRIEAPGTASISDDTVKRSLSCCAAAARKHNAQTSRRQSSFSHTGQGPMTKTAAYDSAEFLDTPEALQCYLEEAMDSGDSGLIAHAIGVAARAKGMSDVARRSRRSRESLYRSLSASGKPEFGTVIDVLKALGLRLSVKAEPAKPQKGTRKKAKAA